MIMQDFYSKKSSIFKGIILGFLVGVTFGGFLTPYLFRMFSRDFYIYFAHNFLGENIFGWLIFNALFFSILGLIISLLNPKQKKILILIFVSVIVFGLGQEVFRYFKLN